MAVPARKDRGATAMEWALLTPIILLVILLCIQFAMVYHANHIALAAAQSGSRAAREAGPGGWEGVGDEAARNTVAQLGTGALLLTGVTPYGDGVYDRGFEVTGTAKAGLPWMTFTVTKRAVGPVECFRPDVGAAKDCEEDGE